MNRLSDTSRTVCWALGWATTVCLSTAAGAVSVDVSKLPEPVSRSVDFESDIRPILEKNCLRCHGPERPKGHFRLTDRDAAFKGGSQGLDILPGDSSGSPLIHYVAQLVPDMEMPPENKGTPLDAEQISLLRKWIDQGLPWGTNAAPTSSLSVVMAPAVGGVSVHGDKSKFRQLEGRPAGMDGGIEELKLRQESKDRRIFTLDGRFLRDDDHLKLEWSQSELGFIRIGFDQYRRYDDSGGGYAAGFVPPLVHSDTDLYVDRGRASFDVGWNRPDLPAVTIGYEYQFADGSKSMLSWGPVNSISGNPDETRSIFPSTQQIHERAHIVRVGITHEVGGYQLENRLQLEFYDSNTRRTDALSVSAGQSLADLRTEVEEYHRHTQVLDHVSVQKQLTDGWLAGMGYRYSWLDGDSSLRLTPKDGAGQPSAGSAWSADRILLNEVWQLFNAFSQYRPITNLTLTAGVQAQWKQRETFGDVHLDEVVDPADPTTGTFRLPATERSLSDQTTIEESVMARYTGVPWTSLFAEARLRQETYRQSVEQDGGLSPVSLVEDADVRWQDFRIGFNTSPRRWISFGGHYRHRDRLTDYAYPVAQRDTAYPGFILARDVGVHEIEPRVVLQPVTWFKSTVSYQWSTGTYRTTTGSTDPNIIGSDATPGGRLYAGESESHSIQLNSSATVTTRWFLSGGLGYQKSRTTSASQGSLAVAPYLGDIWSLQAGSTFLVDDKTEWQFHYLHSQAAYGQHHEATGLPLGIDYQRHGFQTSLSRRFTPSVTGRLTYGYFAYSEPSSAHLHDYTAHQLMAVVRYTWY